MSPLLLLTLACVVEPEPIIADGEPGCPPPTYQAAWGECVCSPLVRGAHCTPTEWRCEDGRGDVMLCDDAAQRATYDEPCEWYEWRVDGVTRYHMTPGQLAEECWQY